MGFWPDDGAPFDLITDLEGPTTTMFVQTAVFLDFNIEPVYDPNFPYMTAYNIGLIYQNYQISVSKFTILLLWNAGADLDLSVTCHDEIEIDT